MDRWNWVVATTRRGQDVAGSERRCAVLAASRMLRPWRTGEPRDAIVTADLPGAER